MDALNQVMELEARMNQSILGQSNIVRKLIITLLADGNMLLEGLPGLAKTRAIKSMSRELDCQLNRIQFTPDLLPSDITGTEVFQPEDKDNPFVFEQGPIFANLVLADEINRAPAKVQSSLLEAMEERQVTVAGKTYQMDPLFLVLATQNPVEQEGTYPLPEAQLDRFIMKGLITYPSKDIEKEILMLVRGEAKSGVHAKGDPISRDIVFEARKAIQDIKVSDAAQQYIVDIIDATRFPEKLSEDLRALIDFGASPRGTIALDKCSRVVAWLNGRDHVVPDDVREIVHDVLRHRLILSYEAGAKGISTDRVIDDLLKVVAVPG